MGCTRLKTLAVLTVLMASQPVAAQEAAPDAGTQAKAAVEACHAKQVAGELKGFLAAAQCSAPLIFQAYDKANYRYMDLINLTLAKRAQISDRLDRHDITGADASAEFQRILTDLADAERKRDPFQSSAAVQASIAVVLKAFGDSFAAVAACRAKRLAGELKSYAASAQCSVPLITEAFNKVNFPYTDLVATYVAKRTEVAGRLDRNEETLFDAAVDYEQAFVDFIDADVTRSAKQQ